MSSVKSSLQEENNPNNSISEISKFFSVDILGAVPKLLIPSVTLDEYTDSISPDTYNKEFTSTSAQVLMGQGIKNNNGLQLVQIIGSKMPSYEDFANRPSGVVHHKKTMLDGLLASTGLDAPTTSFKSINDLSSKLLQLPMKNKDEEPELKARYFNGLPYFDESECLYKISELKKDPTKLKELENIHGAVIANQFLNNKRKLRNFQWQQYYNDRSGNSATNNLQVKLKSNIKENTVMMDEEALIEEAKEEMEKVKRAEAAAKKKALDQAQAQAQAQATATAEQPQQQQGPPTFEDAQQAAVQPPPSAVPVTASVAEAAPPAQPQTVAEIPVIPESPKESEEEIKAKLEAEKKAKEERIINRLKEQELRKNIKKHKRFIYNDEEYTQDFMKDTVIVEEEVITQNLNYIPNFQNSQPPEVTKLVRKRKRPNPNSIGHSNIRGVKPSYWN